MRKRVDIGLLAVAVIAVVVYFCAQSAERTVQYQTRTYWNAFYNRGCSERVRDRLASWTGWPVNAKARAERRERRLAVCEQRLVKLGYLEERRLDIFGHHPDAVVYHVARQEGITVPQMKMHSWGKPSFRLATESTDGIVRIATRGDFSVVVVAPKTSIDSWEETVRKADRVNTAVK